MKSRPVIIVPLILVAIFLGSLFARQSISNTQSPEMLLNKGYDEAWAMVDSLEEKGLNRSAWEVVEAILKQAKDEKETAHHVKAIIYIAKYITKLEDNGQLEAIKRVKLETDESEFPAKPFLLINEAKLFEAYLDNQLWRILERTDVIGQGDDIELWTTGRLSAEIAKLYLAALDFESELMLLSVDDIPELVEEDRTARILRPTFYDHIAQIALLYFSTKNDWDTKPKSTYQLSDPIVFEGPESFASHIFHPADSMDYTFISLNILQSLTAAHLNDETPAALTDITLQRLAFAKRKFKGTNADDHYIEALKNLGKKYPDHESNAEVIYHIAKYYRQLAEKYQAGTQNKYKWYNIKALEQCNKAISNYPDAYGGEHCKALKSEIESKYLMAEMENVINPDMPFLSKIAYTNVNKIHIRIAEWSSGLQDTYEALRYDEKMNFLLSQPALKTWTQKLPDDGDYQRHSVEIKMSPLERGKYLVLFSADESFVENENGVAYAFTQISRLACFSRLDKQNNLAVVVVNRQTGQPLERAVVSVHERKYNYISRAYHYSNKGQFKTNKKGVALIPPDDEYRDFTIKIRHKADELDVDRLHYQPSKAGEYKSQPTETTHFFSDRKIYRPGQTVYFKGIMLSSYQAKHELQKNKSTWVTLYDVNGEIITQQTFVTNEFGSFSGSFQLPSGLLTGAMQLENESGSLSFSVEEYKRPRFYVETNPVSSSFSLGDSISIDGKALAYAGSNIDNAAVSYQVTRTASFPYFDWFFWRPPVQPIVISTGNTSTDEQGNFSISFIADPDPEINPETNAFFTYSVQIDISDLTGETRSTSTTITVGFVALELDLDIREEIQSGTDTLKLTAKNLAGEKQNATGMIEVRKLQAPTEVLRPRLWGTPDTFVMNRNQFKTHFPSDPFDKEDDYHHWAKGDVVLEQSFNTGQSESVVMNTVDWEQGKYHIKISSQDHHGNPVVLNKYFTLIDNDAKSIPLPEVCQIRNLNPIVEPGGKAVFEIGSALKNLHVLYEMEFEDDFVIQEWIKLNRGKKTIEIPVEEIHRGNFIMHFTYTYMGRHYTETKLVQVPWTNKKLDISFETFRDKLDPGKEETWKVKISGPNAEAAASEMLAAMYDVSLDEFVSNSWQFDIYTSVYSSWNTWDPADLFGSKYFRLSSKMWNTIYHHPYKSYEKLKWLGYYIQPVYFYKNGFDYDRGDMQGMALQEVMVVTEDESGNVAYEDDADYKFMHDLAPSPEIGDSSRQHSAPIRTRLDETAFFFPHLQTDEDGTITFTFTTPEALTRWKFLALAHTSDLSYGLLEEETVTQKELMVMPNAPRFLREGDSIWLSTKVANLSENSLDGTVTLQVFDARTRKPLQSMILQSPDQKFETPAGQSAALSWLLYIPKGLQALTYRISATAGNFTDGEESVLPVLSNRMLVTESLPFFINGKKDRVFTLEKIKEHQSATLSHHKLTLEFTSNPAWYAIQALPYMMEYPYECSEQVFSRYYANALATHIVNTQPVIKNVFDQWKSSDALLSNLEKNQELKSILLEETPWVRQAGDEQEQKKRIALLFDINKMSNELHSAMTKLMKNQTQNGGWPWFAGMPENRYITQHIVAGFGHLAHLGIHPKSNQSQLEVMIENALHYLDERMKEDYDQLHDKNIPLDKDNIGYLTIHYLYARSFFSEYDINNRHQEAFDYWKTQIAKYWLDKGNYMQGMIALVLSRYEEQATALDIMNSLRENAIVHDEMGMYWSRQSNGYYWYQAPIETHALLIEAFHEVAKDEESVRQLKVWLLKNKQTNRWSNTKSTTEACYALLMSGNNWLETYEYPTLKLAGQLINPFTQPEIQAEAGTGYFKKTWDAHEITPNMATVNVSGNENSISWGALYWQYFEDLDKITPGQSPLTLHKELFKVLKTMEGEKLLPIDQHTELKTGDLIKVKIVLRSDRDLEFVHMKDMRAAGFEPLNVLSGYRYRHGLGYYESTRDAATNFFFARLPKGTHVFEYPLRVFNKGDFSNGITSVQCMYAPEFAAHSEGIRVRVE